MNNTENKNTSDIYCATKCINCPNESNESLDNFKKCLQCREAERTSDKKLRIKKVNNSIIFNETNNDLKMCKICNCTESIDNFDDITSKCSSCSLKSKLSCKIRNPRDQEKSKLYDYKKSANKKKLEFNISNDEFFNLVKSSCHYCDYNDSVIGVDRKNSDIGYVKTNVLPCCEICNLMKNDSNYDDFLSMCEHITTVNKKFNGKLNHNLFHVSPNGTYSRFKYDAKKRDLLFELTKDELVKIVTNKCVYCNSSGDGHYGFGAGGIDRVDSSIGYVIKNCVPCCYSCNRMKLNYTKGDFINQCYKITIKFNKIDTLESDILEFFEKYSKNKDSVKRDIPTFFHSSDFYEFRKWNGNLVDLMNVNIELEFVENADQKDIWNYYRWKISSLKTFKPNNFVGRIICVLIKDSHTNKYLGIMSLSSDIIAMKNRDDAIGWTNESKLNNKKINHLMNLSTCVSIQPFGFNFNGGKLLAKLAFSKEVIDKFYNKFNQDLLVIVTTGLYGKSVQYDRLNEFKYVGNTKGNSIYWIPEEITNKCREFLKIYHNFDTTGLKKIAIISKIVSVLNLNKEEIMSDNEKGIYIGFTRPDAAKYLCEKTTHVKHHKFKPAQEIFNDWLNRWAIQRYTHLADTNRLSIHNHAKSTDRTTRHKEKLKKDLGEEKYSELLNFQNKQSYSNKKSKISDILQNCNNNIGLTTTERVKKHYDKMKEELGEEKYIEFIKNMNKQSYEKKKINSDKVTPHTSGGLILPTNFSYFQNPPSFCINKYIDKKRITTRYTLRSKNIQKEFDDFINIVNLKFPQLNIQPYKIPGLSESLSPENLSKPVMPSNFSICVVNGADHIQFCKKIHDKQQLHRTKINSHDLQVELDKFIDKLNDKFGLKLEKTNYKIINTNGWQTTNKFNTEIDL